MHGILFDFCRDLFFFFSPFEGPSQLQSLKISDPDYGDLFIAQVVKMLGENDNMVTMLSAPINYFCLLLYLQLQLIISVYFYILEMPQK